MTYNDQIQVALESAVEPARTDEVTLSTGVVLRFKPFPIMRIQAVAEQFPYPEVPKLYDEDKKKWFAWAGSEEYAKQVTEVDQKRGLAVVDTIIAIGTEVTQVPDGFPKLEDDSWIDELAFSSITVKKDSPIARYHAWVKYVCVMNEEDLAKVTSYASSTLGTSEVNVANQLQDNFQDN